MSYIEEFKGVSGAMGMLGHKWITASETGDANHEYCAIQATEDAVVSYTDIPTGTANASKALPKGMTIVGRMNAITCVSGTVIIYVGKKPV